MTFLANWTTMAAFGGGESESFHCFDCCFVSSVKWWTHVSSIVTNLPGKSAGSTSDQCKLSQEMLNQMHFWASVRGLWIHLAGTFPHSQFCGQSVKNTWVVVAMRLIVVSQPQRGHGLWQSFLGF